MKHLLITLSVFVLSGAVLAKDVIKGEIKPSAFGPSLPVYIDKEFKEYSVDLRPLEKDPEIIIDRSLLKDRSSCKHQKVIGEAADGSLIPDHYVRIHSKVPFKIKFLDYGIHGPEIQNAVREFAKKKGIDISGYVASEDDFVSYGRPDLLFSWDEDAYTLRMSEQLPQAVELEFLNFFRLGPAGRTARQKGVYEVKTNFPAFLCDLMEGRVSIDFKTTARYNVGIRGESPLSKFEIKKINGQMNSSKSFLSKVLGFLDGSSIEKLITASAVFALRLNDLHLAKKSLLNGAYFDLFSLFYDEDLASFQTVTNTEVDQLYRKLRGRRSSKIHRSFIDVPKLEVKVK